MEVHEVKVLDKAIHCQGCEARIQKALAKTPGVSKVSASHKTQTVEVILDLGIVSLERIKEQLEELGFKTA